MIETGHRYEIECIDLSVEGDGIGRQEDRVVFVPDLLPGEKALVHITGQNRRIFEGRAEQRLLTSQQRCVPCCPQFGFCGGCSLQHAEYTLQLAFKRKRVKDCFARICGLEVEVPLPLSVPPSFAYRNKASFPVRQLKGKAQVGYLEKNSGRLVAVEKCALLDTTMNEALSAFSEWLEKSGVEAYDPRSHRGLVRRFMVRKSANGELMAAVEINGTKLPQRELLIDLLANRVKALAGICLAINRTRGADNLAESVQPIYGKERMQECINGLKFDISMQTFLQVNHDAAELLYTTALDMAQLTPEMRIVDLYCGAGTITLQAAKRCAAAYGIEIVQPAITDAKVNARNNGITNAEFFCADAGKGFSLLNARGITADTVILDPPRKGTDALTIQEICKCAPRQILYISCDPATLARDVKLLMQKGYFLRAIQPVDLFPQTTHVETVCILSKLKSTQHIEVELDMDELDLTNAEKKATYQEIKDYVLEHTGWKVSSLYIAQVKQKCGIIERKNYNEPKSEDVKQPQCPPDKEKAIKEALKHLGII